MNKSYFLSVVLVSILCFVSCGDGKVESKLSPKATVLISSMEANTPAIADDIADVETIAKRRNMLGETLTDNELASDTLIIIETFAKSPAKVYRADVFNTKEYAVISYETDNKRTGGRKKNIIEGEYELVHIETTKDNLDLLQAVADNGLGVIQKSNSKLSMFKSLKSAATVVSLLTKDGDNYKVTSVVK